MKPGALNALVLIAVLHCTAVLHTNAGQVTVSGRQILVGGAAFQARGVCYAPTPIGQAGDLPPYGDYFTANHSTIYNRDLPRMRRMGVNCLRIYGWNPSANHTAFLDAAYNNGQRPIYVTLNRWVDPNTDWSNTNAVNLIIAEWLTLATNVMHHPAVLGFLIGNELNWAGNNRQNPAFWAALNRIAGAIRQKDPNHLLSTTLADVDLIASIKTFDPAMTNFNAWCVQTYRGDSFGLLFREYAGASAKPLFVTEFGMDAYDRRVEDEYPANAQIQAEFVESQWGEIAGQSQVVSGGFVFAWADEWWKAGSSWSHNSGGWAGGQFPDGWADEEWWGINRTVPGSGAPDTIEPRMIYERLRALWTARLSGAFSPSGQAQVIVSGAPGQTAVLQQNLSLNTGAWVPVTTNTIPFTNAISSGENARLFRVELK